MFISSMAKYNTRKVKSEIASGIIVDRNSSGPASSPSKFVFVSGSKQDLRPKSSSYKSNTEKTIYPGQLSSSRPQTTHSRNKSVNTQYNCEVFQPNESYQKQMLGHGNSRRQYHGRTLSSPVVRQTESDWYTDPVHRKVTERIYCNTTSDTENLENTWPSKHRYEEKDDLDTRPRTGITPYQLELMRLRYEKLKLEETFLLHQKCKQELERTRGPKPKWYELKTKEFTTEMEKYSNLMKQEPNWLELVEYRNKLLKLSGESGNLRQ